MSWSSKPLGGILEQSGRDRAGDQDLPVLSITMKHGLVDQADKFKKRVASSDTSNYRIAYRNELVVGFPIDEGVLGFQTKYPAGIVSPAYDIWKLQRKVECYIPYLERYLRSSQARSLYASRMQGAVARRRSLTKTDFLKLEIPFPPLDDQIRIAHLLGKVEGLIAQRKQHLEQLDDLLKSVFLEMFGDPVKNDRGWDMPILSKFGWISTGNTPPRKDPTNFDEKFVEWIKTDNISNNSLFVTKASEFLSKTGEKRGRTVSEGALLVACIAGSIDSIGRAALTNRTVAFNQQMNAIQPANDVNPFYLYALFKLSKTYIQSHASKGMKKILSKGDFEKIKMIKPPIELQDEYAAILERIESIRNQYQHNLNNLEALFGSLSQKAFKGELDLSRIKLPELTTTPTTTEEDNPLDMPAFLRKSNEPATPKQIVSFLAQKKLPDDRRALITQWFEHYLTETAPDSHLGSAQFLESTWQVLQSERFEIDGETPAITMDDYDMLKELIFGALGSGKLRQHFDEKTNQISLQKPPAEWGSW
jgi:type I restriction enzyme, S subunit